MSVTTSQRINQGTLGSLLAAQGMAFGWTGALLESASPKTITQSGGDDTALQAAINTAANQFVDLDANRATLQQRAQTALTTNTGFLAIPSPTQAQAIQQIQVLTRECSGIIRILLNQLDSTAGT